MLQNYSFCTSRQNSKAANCILPHHKPTADKIPKATFYAPKDRVLPCKRPPFALQKTSFYNALEINLLQRQWRTGMKTTETWTGNNQDFKHCRTLHLHKNIAKNLAE